MAGIPSASELCGEPTCFLGLWWRSGVHLCVSAEAVQVPFDGLQRIIPTLLSRLSTHQTSVGTGCRRISVMKNRRMPCRVGRTSPWAWRCWAASASVSAPQTVVASCLPPAFSAAAPGVFWRGGQSEVVRWSSEMIVSYQQINSLNHRVNAASIDITVQYEKLSKCCNWIVQNFTVSLKQLRQIYEFVIVWLIDL